MSQIILTALFFSSSCTLCATTATCDTTATPCVESLTFVQLSTAGKKLAVVAKDDDAQDAYAWRISAATTGSGWAWDVQRLKFLTASGELQLGENGCEAIDSGSVADHGAQYAYYAPEKAFNDAAGLWGGRKSNDIFYLGLQCSVPMDVTEVQILQSSDVHYAETIKVERLVDGSWSEVSTAQAQEVQTLETIYTSTTEDTGFEYTTSTTVDAWRISAETTGSGWAWDVQRLKFLTASGEVELGENGCEAIDSGSVSDEGAQYAFYVPESAFNDAAGLWGGRKSDGIFYLGLQCSVPMDVTEVQILQSSDVHYAETIKVERLVDGSWSEVSTAQAQEVQTLETIYMDPLHSAEQSLPDTAAGTTSATPATTPCPVHTALTSGGAWCASDDGSSVEIDNVKGSDPNDPPQLASSCACAQHCASLEGCTHFLYKYEPNHNNPYRCTTWNGCDSPTDSAGVAGAIYWMG